MSRPFCADPDCGHAKSLHFSDGLHACALDAICTCKRFVSQEEAKAIAREVREQVKQLAMEVES